MKKLLTLLAVAMFSLPAYAVTCGQYMTMGCAVYTSGLSKLMQIQPLIEFTSAQNYFGFDETAVNAIGGLDDQIAWNGLSPDNVPSGGLNALETKSIQDLYTQFAGTTVAGHHLAVSAGSASSISIASADLADATSLGQSLMTGATAATDRATLGAFATPTGTTSQVVLGDGSLGTLPVAVKVYDGTTVRNGAALVYKSATVASGVAVYNFTNDGTSTGTALWATGPVTSSVNAIVSDATAGYQLSWAWSNSNKTLTVTANKTSIALGLFTTQAAANGAVVNVSVTGY